MNIFNLVIATILAPTLVYAIGRDATYYKKIRKLAIGCMPNTEPWPDPSSPGCNTCSCVSEGVVICTTMKCEDNKVEENPPPEPENGPEPELDIEPEPEEETGSPSNNEVVAVYKKLRLDATGCRPGQEVPTDPCAGCKCILPGVMRCNSANCLLPQQLLGKECHGFGCYKPPGK